MSLLWIQTLVYFQFIVHIVLVIFCINASGINKYQKPACDVLKFGIVLEITIRLKHILFANFSSVLILPSYCCALHLLSKPHVLLYTMTHAILSVIGGKIWNVVIKVHVILGLFWLFVFQVIEYLGETRCTSDNVITYTEQD